MDLESGEQIIFEGHPSWRSIVGFYLKGVLLAAIAGAIAAGVTRLAQDEVKTGIVVLVVVAMVAIVIVGGWLKRLWTTYVITDKRLYIKRGIISRREQQTQLSRIQNVNTSQSVLQRMLMVGNVDFDTAAGDDYDFSFAGVASPQDVVAAVHRAQRVSEGASA